jgi:hypothetical protein
MALFQAVKQFVPGRHARAFPDGCAPMIAPKRMSAETIIKMINFPNNFA